MSLGYNMLQRRNYTDMAGGVGGSVLPMPRRRMTTTMSSATRAAAASRAAAAAAVAPPSSLRAAFTELKASAPPPLAEKKVVVEEEVTRALHEEMQWVFADVLQAPLLDADTLAPVATAGARGLFVYPMRTDAASGRVRMRMKTVDPDTGQLDMRWVVVYDPETDRQALGRFSFVS
jgi:hypothetical protein